MIRIDRYLEERQGFVMKVDESVVEGTSRINIGVIGVVSLALCYNR